MSWLHCSGPRGRHWGRYGAAGLLLATQVDSDWLVLLDERADWVHHGGTIGVPGGAMNSGERPIDAAFREVREEVHGLDAVKMHVVAEHPQPCTYCRRWTYTTIVARTEHAHPVQPRSFESAGVRWVELDQVDDLALHPGFAAAWPSLRMLIRRPGSPSSC